MKRRTSSVGWAILVAVSATMAGCGSGKSPTSADPSGATTTITGSEQLGWTQAADAPDAAAYTYLLYVDGTAVALTGVACARPAGGDYSCMAPLPRLSTGRHVLELAAVNTAGTEGPRSPAIVVTVAGS